jgi:hypothetical protein
MDLFVYLWRKSQIRITSESLEQKTRKNVFISALTDEKQQLQDNSQQLITGIEELSLAHDLSTKKNHEITDVIFVIHGIRDEGHWTNKIARRVILKNKEANGNRSDQDKRYFALETSRYGYFPMLLFALPWTRRAKVAWFTEQYAENLVLYPKAEFSFIGHSNGTYLLAQALKEYECCRFKRIVFAGSVAPKEYNWSNYIEAGRVQQVLNYVATGDWVVAIFPNFLHYFQRDLGSAGHDGFSISDNKLANIKYIKGDHGAALNEHNWDAIAEFIVKDSPDLPKLDDLKQPSQIFQEKRCNFLSIIGKFPGLVWILIILIFGYLGYSILFLSGWGEWEKTVIFMFYLWGIWKILTTV